MRSIYIEALGREVIVRGVPLQRFERLNDTLSAVLGEGIATVERLGRLPAVTEFLVANTSLNGAEVADLDAASRWKLLYEIQSAHPETRRELRRVELGGVL
jgi:hypothetical protein